MFTAARVLPLAAMLLIIGVTVEAQLINQSSADQMAANATARPANGTKKVGILRTCGMMNWKNWDEIEYACHWDHSNFADDNFNLFFKRYDWARKEGSPHYGGSLIKECNCDDGLSTYGPWGSHWKYSTWKDIGCYTRNGYYASQVAHHFDSIGCGRDTPNRDCDQGIDDCY